MIKLSYLTKYKIDLKLSYDKIQNFEDNKFNKFNKFIKLLNNIQQIRYYNNSLISYRLYTFTDLLEI